MDEMGNGTRSEMDRGSSDALSNDLRHFISIDLQIFERLNQGDLQPFRITLRDGRQITGEPKGIARGFSDEIASRSWGRVLIATTDGVVELNYLEIVDVA